MRRFSIAPPERKLAARRSGEALLEVEVREREQFEALIKQLAGGRRHCVKERRNRRKYYGRAC
jgi:hypothetical protein